MIDLYSLTVEEQTTLIQSIEADIKANFTQELSNFGMPGICVGLKYGLSQEFCLGYSDNLSQTVMTSDMNFRIGQTTQILTATAIFGLIELGQLTLNTTIDSVLPTELVIPNKEQITIYHLLHMTSGLPDYTFQLQDYLTSKTPTELINLISEQAALFNPGEGFDIVGNTNYVLLGMIIEQKSGKNYSTYISEMIQAFNFTNIKVPTTNAVDDPAANGYLLTYNEEDQSLILTDSPEIDKSLYYASQSLISDVKELTEWMFQLIQGKILTTTLSDLLEFSITNIDGTMGAGIQQYDQNRTEFELIGKISSFNGYSSSALFDYNNSIAVTIFINVENYNVNEYQLYLSNTALRYVYENLQIGTNYFNFIPFLEYNTTNTNDTSETNETENTTDNNDSNYDDPFYNDSYDDNDYSDLYFSEPFSEREIIEFISVICLIFLALAFIRT